MDLNVFAVKEVPSSQNMLFAN